MLFCYLNKDSKNSNDMTHACEFSFSFSIDALKRKKRNMNYFFFS